MESLNESDERRESFEKIQVNGYVPVEIIPSISRCVIDMTEEERDEFFKEMGEENYNRYLENKKTKCFNRCIKTDWCKIEREKKEKEEKEKEEKIKILEERNKILEEHARQQEKALSSLTIDTNTKIEKLAGLIQQLLKK